MQRRSESGWKAAGAAASVAVALLLASSCGDEPANAQAIMRTPTINIPSRTPTINTNIAPRVSPNIAGRTVNGIEVGGAALRPRLSTVNTARPVLPYARYSPNLYPACTAAYRDADGECIDQPLATADGGSGAGKSGKKGAGNARRNTAQAAVNLRTIPNEFVAELDSGLSESQANELLRSHGLARVASETFPLIGATVGLFRIVDGRNYETTRRQFASADGVKWVQPNYRYLLQDQKAAASEGDPAQYALAKLRLPEAHTVVHGANVTVAVIDSGIDARHPELANSIADNFDALGGKEGAHIHGTGVAGAIAAHSRLMGSAPEARIIAIRAFGGSAAGAESSSYVILKALNYAAEHGAQIVNMSFAGPKDAVIERAIAATAARGLVLIAAAGNAGANSPPLYPAANPNVIAVSATDAQDKLFAASNRGNYVALAAPGVDIFLPAPDGKYQMTSGTSFAAAYVSGVAALLLERNFALKPEALRQTLAGTARDLGSPGRDDLFGNGEVDAYAAVMAVPLDGTTPLAASGTTKREGAPEHRDEQGTRALQQPSLSSAADKSTVSQADRPAAR
ncbi:S8 family serine peptidase [Bradyrhizobium sp.]|uniref:S8 family serine peptidase n=1 Tax=Bradyrhizobium sp. TaxID=376 RepID=UPI0023864665|nr:S8 family serine peptidase [Bradyrhizobium sp.]MDE2378946.1 S8 family serine peptidase [Bradyrhizobium sp.]